MASYLAFTVEDGKGERATRQIYLTGVQADMYAAGVALLDFIVPLMTGRVVEAGVFLQLPNPTGNPASPGAASDVQEMARFAFDAVSGITSYVTAVTIPTFLEDLFVAGSKLVDITDTDVLAFLLAMISGLTGVHPSTSHGEDITALGEAREAWGKYRP